MAELKIRLRCLPGLHLSASARRGGIRTDFITTHHALPWLDRAIRDAMAPGVIVIRRVDTGRDGLSQRGPDRHVDGIVSADIWPQPRPHNRVIAFHEFARPV